MTDSGRISASSARWRQRQGRDVHVRAAAREGYRSRSAYKLLEMDARFRFLRCGARVVDLGAAPGGWSQVAAQRIGAGVGREWLVGVDVLDIAPLAGCRFVKGAFPVTWGAAAARTPLIAGEELAREVEGLLGRRADVVLSDMLANVSGNRLVDHERSLELCRLAEAFAGDVLAAGGVFCCKLLRGGDGREERDMLADWRRRFQRVVRFKPAASRAESAEIYVLAFRHGSER